MADSRHITRRALIKAAPIAGLATLPVFANALPNKELAGVSASAIHQAYFCYLQLERQALANQIYGKDAAQRALQFVPINTAYDMSLYRQFGPHGEWAIAEDAKSRSRLILTTLGVTEADF